MKFFEFEKSTDFCANKQIREKIKKEVLNQLICPLKKPILIYGPNGVGKTYFVQMLAEELNLELFQINGYNLRTRKAILNAKQIASQQSLFGIKKLIFIDDAEAIPGRLAAKTKTEIEKEKEDKKKAGKRKIKDVKLKNPQKEIEELIKDSKYPVIFSTDDISAKFVKMLKKMSFKFEFEKPSVEELTDFLSGVCIRNDIECEKKALNFIARICDGDVRCALIELNVSSYLTTTTTTTTTDDVKITYENISKDNFRDASSDIKKCLKIIFRSKSIDASRDVMSKCNEDKGTFLEWVRENIPYEYSKETDVKNAYEMLSNADLFLGRIKVTYWRYLIYTSALLSAGVCSAKKERYDFNSNKFRFPSKIATFARMKFHTNNDAQIIEEFRENCHLSKKKIKDNIAVYRHLYNH